jgi:flavorubredoxin
VLVMIQNPYPLNGRVTNYPKAARGFTASNCYLIVEGGHGLLLDTGLTVHEADVLSALEHAGADGMQLDIFALRLGEYDSVCNVRPIAERFTVRRLYGGQRNGRTWVDFRPEWTPPGAAVGSPRLDGAEYVHVRSHATISIDPGGRHTVEVMRPALRLLTTHWVYEPESETLFTSDSFTYVTREHATGPWVTDGDDRVPSVDEVADYLQATRFWWLCAADSERLIDELQETVDRYSIKRLAPAHGCVVEGSSAVAAHVDVLARAIRQLAQQPVGIVAAP